MKAAIVSTAISTILLSLAPAEAGNDWDKDDQTRIRSIKWMKAAYAKHKFNVPTESISCVGPNGAMVSYQTTTKEQRTLTSAIKVRIANRSTVVPQALMSTYLNEDDMVVIEGYGLGGGVEKFSLRLKLVRTTAPKSDEVATYSGTVSVGGKEADVTCSATRKGAGVLKPQNGTTGSNLIVYCMREGEVPNTAAASLVNFEVARSHSQRLVSDLNENRGATDTEVLPSFLTSQYSFDKAAIDIEMDDGSVEGNMIARLEARGIRVPTNQPADDPAIYGVWAGTYQRYDAGRQIKEEVDCFGF